MSYSRYLAALRHERGIDKSAQDVHQSDMSYIMDKIKKALLSAKNAVGAGAEWYSKQEPWARSLMGAAAGSAVGTGLGAAVGGIAKGKKGAGRGTALGAILGAIGGAGAGAVDWKKVYHAIDEYSAQRKERKSKDVAKGPEVASRESASEKARTAANVPPPGYKGDGLWL